MILIRKRGEETVAWSSDMGWVDITQAETIDQKDADFLMGHFRRYGFTVAAIGSPDVFIGWHPTGMAVVK